MKRLVRLVLASSARKTIEKALIFLFLIAAIGLFADEPEVDVSSFTTIQSLPPELCGYWGKQLLVDSSSFTVLMDIDFSSGEVSTLEKGTVVQFEWVKS